MKKFLLFIILVITICILFLFYKGNTVTTNQIKYNETAVNEISNPDIVVDISNSVNNIIDSTSHNEEFQYTSYYETGNLELPVNNATGYASVLMNLKSEANINSKNIAELKPGSAFRIIKEEGSWWYVNYSGLYGWLDNTYCMINLPDVIPSIIYNDTNSYSSIFKSSGKSLPDITGKQLYNAKYYNTRLR